MRSFDCQKSGALLKEEADKIASRVQSEYATIRSLEGSFTQESYLSALEVSESSTGTMAFRKPGRMRWDYVTPEAQSFVVKDSRLDLYQPVENQLIIDEFSKILISDLPVAFIMGIGDLTKDFELNGACTSPDGVVLDLTPKSKGSSPSESELKRFKLLVNPSSHLPIGARIMDVGGNITSILLSGITKDPELNENRFSLEIPKGTDVIDRRVGKQE